MNFHMNARNSYGLSNIQSGKIFVTDKNLQLIPSHNNKAMIKANTRRSSSEVVQHMQTDNTKCSVLSHHVNLATQCSAYAPSHICIGSTQSDVLCPHRDTSLYTSLGPPNGYHFLLHLFPNTWNAQERSRLHFLKCVTERSLQTEKDQN